jgi:hypothetical protein
MPDGDRFERRLRGPHWRKAYRLGCGNASFELIGKELMAAVAAAMRGPLLFPHLQKALHAIYIALQNKAVLKTSPPSKVAGKDPYRTLIASYSQPESNENFVANEIEAKVVQSVYLQLESDCDSMTLQRVQDRFSEALVERIIRHGFLAKVRDGMAAENARSAEEQYTWERKLLDSFAASSRDMLRPILEKGRTVVRAPKRITPQRRMTREELDQPLV